MSITNKTRAFIHDAGFHDYALKSASGILSILAQNKIQSGLVVDLGCGSGLSAQEFVLADYQVLGIDISSSGKSDRTLKSKSAVRSRLLVVQG